MVLTRRMEARIKALEGRFEHQRRLLEEDREENRRQFTEILEILNRNSQGSGNCNQNSDDGHTENAESGFSRDKWRKLDIPIFSGEEVYRWVRRVEKYFDLKGVTDQEKIQTAKTAMEGEAVWWSKWWEISALNHTWEDFQSTIIRRFQNRSTERRFPESVNRTHSVADEERIESGDKTVMEKEGFSDERGIGIVNTAQERPPPEPPDSGNRMIAVAIPVEESKTENGAVIHLQGEGFRKWVKPISFIKSIYLEQPHSDSNTEVDGSSNGNREKNQQRKLGRPSTASLSLNENGSATERVVRTTAEHGCRVHVKKPMGKEDVRRSCNPYITSEKKQRVGSISQFHTLGQASVSQTRCSVKRPKSSRMIFALFLFDLGCFQQLFKRIVKLTKLQENAIKYHCNNPKMFGYLSSQQWDPGGEIGL